MNLWTLIIIILVVLLVAGLPHWPYTTPLGYGYYPSSILGVVLIVVLILLLFGRL